MARTAADAAVTAAAAAATAGAAPNGAAATVETAAAAVGADPGDFAVTCAGLRGQLTANAPVASSPPPCKTRG
eukprot:159405-Chlamydomonas_euryale.AAC.1